MRSAARRIGGAADARFHGPAADGLAAALSLEDGSLSHFTVDATAGNALPAGFMLMEYRLMAVLGAGAFGITYLARDLHLEKDAAIKEFLPGGIAVRTADGQVVPAAPAQAEVFSWGLDRFVTEARTLAALSHPHIVRVNRYFEAHGTAYVVMEYERGESFKSYVGRRGPIPEKELKALLGPLLDGLEKVHDAGYLHRDIKPDNILVREQGGLVLLDFGSARRVLPGADKALTAIVSPGYAPVEQYSEAHEQGPWSDIYALGGVLYFAVTGQRPPDSLARMKSDTVRSALETARRRYSGPLIDAIDWALSWDDSARPRSVAVWRMALLPGGAVQSGAGSDRAEATERVAPLSPAQANDATVRIGADDPVRRPGSGPGGSPEGSAGGRAPSPPAAAAGPSPARAGEWIWMTSYLIVAILAVVLASALGGMELFEKTILVRSRSWLERLLSGGGRQELNAAQLVRAIGYVGALTVLWLLARRAGGQLRQGADRWASLGHLLLPFVTLLALPSTYAALLPVAEPLMDATVAAVYNWAFVLATVAAGAWLVFSFFRHFGALAASVRSGAARGDRASG